MGGALRSLVAQDAGRQAQRELAELQAEKRADLLEKRAQQVELREKARHDLDFAVSKRDQLMANLQAARELLKSDPEDASLQALLNSVVTQLTNLTNN